MVLSRETKWQERQNEHSIQRRRTTVLTNTKDNREFLHQSEISKRKDFI